MEPVLSIKLAGLVPDTFEPAANSEIWNHELALAVGVFWKLEGPSGSGKTSLFSFLAGLRRDYSGALLLATKSGNLELAGCNSQAWSEIRSRHLAFVFQDLRLIDHLSLQENLLLKSNLTPISNRAQELERICELCGHLEIDRHLKKAARQLSRGELQRAAIVRSLLQPFDCLILDEPFSHLDHRLEKMAANLIARECKNRSAGAIVLDLQPDELFPYQSILGFGGRL